MGNDGGKAHRLQLKLLGAAEASIDGHGLTFRTRKSFALLVYLTSDPGPHARDRIADLLWPEADGVDTRTSLRTALNYLRQGLGAAADSVLVTSRDTLGVRTGSIETDVVELQQAHRLMRKISDPNLRKQLEIAVDGYQGPFLAGTFLADAPEFEAWIEAQRAHWRGIEAELLNRLATMQIEAGEPSAAVATLEKWTVVNPDDEIAWERLIELQLAENGPVAARRAWDAYCRVSSELNPLPGTAMSRIHQRISGYGPQLVQTVTHRSVSLDFGTSPLVGRTREWAQLTASYRRVREGRTEVIILQGAPGVGKSRLASEFVTWARDSGSDVIRGRGFEAVRELPYAALIEALRPRLEAENAPEDLLSDLWLAELSRLLPELRDRYPDLPVPSTDALGRSRTFEAVTRLGIGLARRRPLAVLIDDAQWADTDTRDLLRYAIRRWSETQTPVLILLSARTAQDSDPTVQQWFSAIEDETAPVLLELTPLQPGDVAQLVSLLAGCNDGDSDRADEFGRWLADNIGGRPRPLIQALRGMVERGVLRVRSKDDSHWVIEPPAATAIPDLAFAGVRG